MRYFQRSKPRYKITGTKHLRMQLSKRFGWLGISYDWVLSCVRKTLNKELLYPNGVYWVRLLQLSKEVRLEADTKDGSVNGDTLYAVVRWSDKEQLFSITTVLLRRDGQTTQCDALYDSIQFRLVKA